MHLYTSTTTNIKNAPKNATPDPINKPNGMHLFIDASQFSLSDNKGATKYARIVIIRKKRNTPTRILINTTGQQMTSLSISQNRLHCRATLIMFVGYRKTLSFICVRVN
jgi:hypothetical protein